MSCFQVVPPKFPTNLRIDLMGTFHIDFSKRSSCYIASGSTINEFNKQLLVGHISD